MSENQIERAIRKWIETMVIGLNLCPFATRPFLDKRVRIVVSKADKPQTLLTDLYRELQFLQDHVEMETTLLIHPYVFENFLDFNDFLSVVETTCVQLGYEGVFQIASFHPSYQFAGTKPEDVENYTNRSPYPILHLLRENSLDYAIESHPDTASIPTNNIKLMQNKGIDHMKSMLNKCCE